jgi:5'-methylthioadenosine phosphorylase
VAKIALISRVAAHQPYLERGVRQKDVRQVQTPFGRSSPIHVFQHGNVEFAVLSRHGEQTYSVSAASVEERANIWALKVLGVEKIVSFDAVGSLAEGLTPGELLLLEDVIDLRGEAYSLFEGKGLGFIRLNPLFCPEGRQVAWQNLNESPFTAKVGGTYACTRGPRMDTRAEAGAYATMGATVVGQALIPEVFVAKELEICYTAVGYVAYPADGIVDRPHRPGVPFEGLLMPSEAQQVDLVEKALPTFFMEWLVDLVEQPRDCPCKDTMLRYKKRGDISEDWKQWIR